MAIAKVRIDGKVGRFRVPEGTTPEEAQELARQQLAQQGADSERAPEDTPSARQSLRPKGRGATSAAIGEPVLTFLTGAAAEPISGLAGIGAALIPGGKSGGEMVEDTRETFTYQPRTQPGQDVMQSGPMQAVGRAVQAVERGAGDIGYEMGGPVGGAVGSAVPAAILEIIGLKGARSAKRAALREQLKDTPEAFTPEGDLKPEVRAVLQEQKLDVGSEDIGPRAQPRGEGVDIRQAERAARFEEFGAKPTKGDLTQDFETQKAEQFLLEATEDSAGRQMRMAELEKSQAIKDSVSRTVDELGVPEDTARAVKEALSTRKGMLKSQRRAAYEKLSEASKSSDIPVISNNMLEGLPDKGEIRTLASLNPGPFKSLSELLVEFGIDSDPRVAKQLERQGVEITPLSVSNFESFRKRLNSISRADQTGQMEVLVSPIRRNLDDEIETMTKTLEQSGGPEVSTLAKDARYSHQALKTEFDEKALTNELISPKRRGSNIPKIEDSKVYQKLASKGTAAEQVDRLVSSLEQAEGGKRALGNLQASMMLDLIDSAFNASTRKVGGTRTFGGAALQKRFKDLESKIDIVFRNNPGALRRIKRMNELAADLTPPSGAVPKGSAGFLQDVFNGLGLYSLSAKIPGAGLLVQYISELGEKSRNAKTLNRALNAKPELKRTASLIQSDYPSLAAALGIGEALSEPQRQEEQQ